MEQNHPNLEPLIFTRYLYSKLYVKHSLLISLLEHQYDESLFWAYEIYYSGLEEEIFRYVFHIYEEFYKVDNPNFINTLNEYYKEWLDNPTQDFILGTVVGTMSHMEYRIDTFMKTYYNINCKSPTKKKTKKQIIISCKQENITRYYTLSPHPQPYKYLRNVGLYPIKINTKQLFHGEYDDVKNAFYYEWLYYASGSPVWLERIEEFKGKVNHETKKIGFLTEEWEELFYNTWGLEPDEQPQNIQDQIIGTTQSEQICIKDFCEKYGSPIVTKKIVKSKK